MGSIAASNVKPCPEVVVMTWRPLALEEIEQSSQELLLKTSGGYWRSLFHGSLFSFAEGFGKLERTTETTETRRAIAARKMAKFCRFRESVVFIEASSEQTLQLGGIFSTN